MKLYILPDGTTVKRVKQAPGKLCQNCYFYDDIAKLPKPGLSDCLSRSLPSCFNDDLTIHYFFKLVPPQAPSK